MIPQPLRVVTEELPWRLRQDVEGYVQSVSAAAPEIFSEVRVRFTDELNEQFLFAVGMKRLWALVNGSYWLLDNSLTLGERNEVTSYQVGSAYQRRGGDLHVALRTLRNDLHAYFAEHELDDIVEARSPREVLARLTERDPEEWT